jgi:predicted RecA/RadA family phage recombinase
MADCYMKHGNPQMADYTPGSAVAAGAVIVINAAAGLTCVIAHHDIAAGEKGAVAVRGGVYDFINLNNAVLGAKVYWDNAVKKATTTATSNALLGVVVSGGAGGANSTCQVLHDPII